MTATQDGGATGRDLPAVGVERSQSSARFWKCALQVNSDGYNKTYRGQDHGLKPEEYLAALLKECQEQGISLVGLADHGSVADVDAIRAHLGPHDIVVLPGFEICTTEKIHWVCLFRENTTSEQLNRYLGSLRLTDPTDGVRPSKLGGEDLLREVTALGGFCYAAHVTSDSGLLEKQQQHLWKDPHLVAAQIPGSVDDLPMNFKRIAANKDPEYQRARPLALINAKDVAKPEDLRDPRASCFIKMTSPGFDALRVAFKDPAARVRLHADMADAHYSRIEYLRIEGGYLDGVDIRFSENLNTLIGGRGTGKSTLLECLRYALGLEHRGAEARKQGDSIIRENLGKAQGRVDVGLLVSLPQQMRHYRVVRRFGEPPRVIDAEGNDSRLTIGDLLPGIEIYGQNEIFEIARDENAFVRVLDRFLPDQRQLQRTSDSLQRKLKANGEKLVAARQQEEELQEQLAKLPRLEEQAKQFDAIGLEAKLKLVPLLEKERQLSPRIHEELERVSSGLGTLRDSLPDTTFLNEKALENLPHANVAARARDVLEGVKSRLEQIIDAATADLRTATAAIAATTAELDQARRQAEASLEKEFATLPDVAGKKGSEVGRTYQALQREIETIRPQQSRLHAVAELLAALDQDRRNFRGELSDLRHDRTLALEKAVKALNKKLAGKLRLEVAPSANRQALKDFLTGLRGIGEKTLSWVDTAVDLTIPALVEACRGGTAALLAKGWGVTPARAEAICDLSHAEVLVLETIDLEDRVELELNVAHEGEVYRPLQRLSTGQQCTAILHLLLLDNTDPLVMDQPEDNLDNAFIADRIVRELRSEKTSRQFIFATHNANIPVFGDAEWIGVCIADGRHGEVPHGNQGSIDVPHIRDEAARILDGGREAFLQRQEKYGY